jgi:hypothetical protein
MAMIGGVHLDQIKFAGYFLCATFAGHVVWEIAQLPFYTLWTSGTRAQIAFAIAHCTLGDVIIATLSLVIARVLVCGTQWTEDPIWIVASLTVGLGVTYTIFSEWLNVSVRGSWAYSDLMPVLPLIGTGLTH